MADRKKSGIFSKLTYKQFIRLVIIIFAVVLVLGVAVFALVSYRVENGFWFWEAPKPDDSNRSINYYEADYGENIFENPRYMDKIRDIYFGDESVFYLLTGDDYEKAGDDAVFFRDFFDAVIRGDNEKYNSFFRKGYYTPQNPPKDEFTMQKIYDIRVLRNGTSEVELDGKTVTLKNYIVEYKIMQNNGTFRTGIDHDSYQPQLFRLMEEDGKLKVHSILDIKVINK